MSIVLLFVRTTKDGESTLSWLIQVKATEPNSMEEKSAVPEADTISAAAAMDPPVGSETGKTTIQLPSNKARFTVGTVCTALLLTLCLQTWKTLLQERQLCCKPMVS